MAKVYFCPECHSMLRPKEDRQNKCLLYVCRNCDYKEKAKSNCIYHHEVMTSTPVSHAGRSEAIPDAVSDPALPRTSVRCPKCNHGEAVYYQACSVWRAEKGITLYFACCKCAHKWHDEQ